jgi:chromosome partitioning protein
VAIANQKGGVGKSTTAVSLGAALADLGYEVLVVDLDPQGNASTGLGIKHDARAVTVYDVLANEAAVDDAVVATPVERLSGVPSTIDLAGAEIELVSQFSRELRLRRALEPLRDGAYDFIFLDCPPSLGLLTVNALAAAEELIVPIQCEYYALEGLGQLLQNVRLVQQNINPRLRLTGIVMTMFDSRTRLSEQVVDEVRRFFGERVYDSIIPRTVRLSEAPGFGQPITEYDPKSRGADSYRALAREVAERPVPEGEAMPQYTHIPTVILPPSPAEAADDPGQAREGKEAAENEADLVPTSSVSSASSASGRAGPGSSSSVLAARGDAEPSLAGPSSDSERSTVTPTNAARPSTVSPPPSPPPPSPPAAAASQAAAAGSRSRAARPAPGEARGVDVPLPTSPASGRRSAETQAAPRRAPDGDDGADAAPPASPAQSGPVADPRVVVIDERAEEAAVQSGQERPRRRRTPPEPQIGEQLPEEGQKKRRWWQFGKGGDA